MAQRGATSIQTLTAQAAGTVTGSSFSIDNDGGVNLAVVVNCTDFTGTTPTADIKVQWSNDGSTWADAETPDTFTQIVAPVKTTKVFPVKGAFARTSVTVAGTTPAFTATISVYPTR